MSTQTETESETARRSNFERLCALAGREGKLSKDEALRLIEGLRILHGDIGDLIESTEWYLATFGESPATAARDSAVIHTKMEVDAEAILRTACVFGLAREKTL